MKKFIIKNSQIQIIDVKEISAEEYMYSDESGEHLINKENVFDTILDAKWGLKYSLESDIKILTRKIELLQNNMYSLIKNLEEIETTEKRITSVTYLSSSSKNENYKHDLKLLQEKMTTLIEKI